MHQIRLFAAALAALPLTACATIEAPPAPAAAEAPISEHDKLFGLFASANEAALERNPLDALLRGDMRYADRLGNYFTPEYDRAERLAAQANLAALKTIDRDALSASDRIAHDTFAYYQRLAARQYSPELLALTAVEPFNHFGNFHTFYPGFASGDGAAPFETLEDYENNLKRHGDYVRMLDNAILRFREGIASGVVTTRLTTRNMIEQFDAQLAQDPEESPFYAPVQNFPDTIAEEDRERLRAAYRAAIEDEIYPVYRRLQSFFADEYLPQAREGHGLVHMKGGEELYRFLIEDNTSLPLTPDQLHELGLAEVARIRGEMEGVKEKMGFAGNLREFFDHVRSDPSFVPPSREWLTENYYEIGRAVDAKLPEFFSAMPKAPLEIRPYEPYREKFEAGGSYQQGAPDGSRPGIFYFNAYDLASRPITQNVTLYLHEGAPGHHFQVSLAQENTDLPDFLRFEYPTAYVEGWALYAETLGYPMGLFEDSVAHYGTLDDEMLRAIRLVVDTGIHAKGWTREQAIDYFFANSAKGEADVIAEVERYIAIPGQALAYKVGALTIQRLRDEAKAELGDAFDIREYHDQVLGTGALPLPVLEAKIRDWVKQKKGG